MFLFLLRAIRDFNVYSTPESILGGEESREKTSWNSEMIANEKCSCGTWNLENVFAATMTGKKENQFSKVELGRQLLSDRSQEKSFVDNLDVNINQSRPQIYHKFS